jgi:hypothetical protein
MTRRLYGALIETQTHRAEREIGRVLGPGALERAFGGKPPSRF